MEYKINQCVEYKNPRLNKKIYCWVTAVNVSESGETTLNLTDMDSGYGIMHVPLKFVAPADNDKNDIQQ